VRVGPVRVMGAGVVLMQCVVEVSTVITKKSYKLKITHVVSTIIIINSSILYHVKSLTKEIFDEIEWLMILSKFPE